MKLRFPFFISFLAIAIILCLHSFLPTYATPNPALLSKGLNLSQWFFLPPDGFSTEHLESWYIEKDFQTLSGMGLTHVRLPIDPIFLQQSQAPYTPNNDHFQYVDRAINWATKYHLGIILDIHPSSPLVLTEGVLSPDFERLRQLWITLAQRYRRQNTTVFYELLNEPRLEDSQVWHEIAQALVETVRAIDNHHTIVVPAAGWSETEKLSEFSPVSDRNVIYTFHFYKPLAFTHQGAFWVPGLQSLQSIPYPYSAEAFQQVAWDPQDPEAQQWLDWYKNDQYNQEKLARDLQPAITFRDQYQVPIYCGELGVYKIAPDSDRERWHREVTELLRRANIGYAIWEHRGNFGMFVDNNMEQLDSNLLNSIGLILPSH